MATVARTYRKAIDDYLEDPEKYKANMEWYKEEIGKCTYREFTTGFYFGKPTSETQIYDSNTYVKNYIYLGTVEERDCERIREDRAAGASGESMVCGRCDRTGFVLLRTVDEFLLPDRGKDDPAADAFGGRRHEPSDGAREQIYLYA